MNEDRYMAAEQDRLYMQRQERDRTDAIIDARHDLVTEAKTLRRQPDFESCAWWESLYRLFDITDRLNELEGDTA